MTLLLTALSILLFGLICGVCSNRVTEIWHHGKIFSPIRRVLLKWQDNAKGIKLWVANLLLCAFCANVWFSCILAFVSLTCDIKFSYLPFIWLLSVYISNLLNDVILSKTPKANHQDLIDHEIEKNNG